MIRNLIIVEFSLYLSQALYVNDDNNVSDNNNNKNKQKK